MDKSNDIYELFNIELDDIEKEIKLFSEKGPVIKVANENPKHKELDKTAIAVSIIKGIVDSKDSIKESIALIKEIREVDLEIAKIYKEIHIATEKIRSYNNALHLKSENIKHLIELYKTKIEYIMKIIDTLPVKSDKEFENKLKLIDRSNHLLSELSNILMQYLSL